MKRFLTIVLFGAAILAVVPSCKKEGGKTSTLPKITWETNEKFAQVEVKPSMEAQVKVTAPNKIEALTITIGLPSPDYIGAVNPFIGINANKGSSASKKDPVLDFVSDASVVAKMAEIGLPAGAGVEGREEVTLNLAKLINFLLEVGDPVNNSSFRFTIKVVDGEQKEVSKTAVFHFTSGPELAWKANATHKVVELNTSKITDCVVTVTAPGKIAAATIKVNSPSAALISDVNTYITTTSVTEPVVDLIDDEKAVTAFRNVFNMATGDQLKGKTALDLNLNAFVNSMPYKVSSTPGVKHTLTLTVTDENEKSEELKMEFVYTAS